MTTVVPVEKKVLNENQRIAEELRQGYAKRGTLCLNIISSPGSGKTTLLEKTLAGFSRQDKVAVLTGDLQTENDARRLARYGFPVQQIVTGTVCHLDGRMIERALQPWASTEIDLLFIENVGNLVCPSSYDLGEEAKIVVLSVTEGEDKPLKYPTIFNSADVAVITKIDLAAAVEFDAAAANRNIQAVRPGMAILDVSVKSGAGLDGFLDFLRSRRADARTVLGARAAT
jgi:hydrogenase nickel incorporation protein HypB